MRKKRTISGRNRIAIVRARRPLPPRSENRSSSERAAYDSEAKSPSSPRTVGMAPRDKCEDRRSMYAKRGYDQENREGRERREIESTQESNGGAECETEEDLR